MLCMVQACAGYAKVIQEGKNLIAEGDFIRKHPSTKFAARKGRSLRFGMCVRTKLDLRLRLDLESAHGERGNIPQLSSQPARAAP